MTEEERIQKVREFADYLDGLRKRPQKKLEINGLAEERMFCLRGSWKEHHRGGSCCQIPPEVQEEMMKGPQPNKY